jgi:hypothetical protein
MRRRVEQWWRETRAAVLSVCYLTALGFDE